jgi:hypothetical protein
MGLDGGVSAIEFDGLLESGNGIDRALKDVDLSVAVDVAGGLIDFDELGLALKVVEEEDAGIFREAEAGRDLGHGDVGAFEFFIEFDCGGRRGLGDAILLVSLCGGPVD